MTLADLVALCDRISPFELQEGWDNSGLIVGDPRAEVSAVAVSLEADEAVIDAAPENCAIIVHHPLIFSPLKQLDFSAYPANLLKKIIQKNQSLIALHTNFDKTHLGRHVAVNVLGWKDAVCDGYLCSSEPDTDFETLARQVKAAGFEIRSIVPADRPVRKATLCTGSGGSLIGKIETDCLITGDVKYHEAVAARTLGVGVIDIGHYESERFFGPLLADELKTYGIAAIILGSVNPFRTFQGNL
ncbi:MAG: Nif3-like dinuclear metal center hexameric protein [Campylobacterales bacterium]